MRLAFVCPRLHEPGTVGGAETLLHSLAVEASRLGHEVEFLVTCAKNHFTWANELPEGTFQRDGIRIRRFPVNAGRDVETFQRLQEAICRGQTLAPEEEETWLRNSVNAGCGGKRSGAPSREALSTTTTCTATSCARRSATQEIRYSPLS